MTKALTFDTGLVEYDINGSYKASFNPTDESFVAKLEATFDSLEQLQETLANDKTFGKFAELDADMRKTIDDLLGDGASDALFPEMNVYAISEGLPVWLNLVFALLDEVSAAYVAEFGKTDARVKALNAKYGAIMGKYQKGKK